MSPSSSLGSATFFVRQLPWGMRTTSARLDCDERRSTLAIAVGWGTNLRYPTLCELNLAPHGKGVRDG